MAFLNDQFHSALGTRDASHQEEYFSLTQDDRRRHVYVVGQTGTGKTTLLESLILQDIHAGRGVCLIDPHGDIADKIANSIPKNRTKHTVYFNPADRDFPIGFNPLSNVPEDQRELVASGIVSSFKGLWGDSWGEWLEYLLKNSIMAMLHYPAPGLSLVALPRFLSNSSFRESVLRYCDDPVVMDFWDNWFSELEHKEELTRVISTLNKAGKLSLSPTLRNILGQRTNGIDFARVMDDEQILLVNLSKGLLGADNSNLLGSLLVSHIVYHTMQRARILEHERVDHHLYIDEFQNFTTREFESILSEARKYRLNLTVAHQYLDQISPDVKRAVLGNVGTLAVFSVGASDAEHLALEFAPYRTDVLSKASRGECWIRFRKDGEYIEPQLVKTFPPRTELQRNSLDRIRRHSRERFSTDRAKVEASLRAFYR
jgi:type IV secretory pathway TraG/TraD family ATPase VirD4